MVDPSPKTSSQAYELIEKLFRQLSKFSRLLKSHKDESYCSALSHVSSEAVQKAFVAYTSIFLSSNTEDQQTTFSDALQQACLFLEMCIEIQVSCQETTGTGTQKDQGPMDFQREWQAFEDHFMRVAKIVLPYSKYQELERFSKYSKKEREPIPVLHSRNSIMSNSSSIPSACSIEEKEYKSFKRESNYIPMLKSTGSYTNETSQSTDAHLGMFITRDVPKKPQPASKDASSVWNDSITEVGEEPSPVASKKVDSNIKEETKTRAKIAQESIKFKSSTVLSEPTLAMPVENDKIEPEKKASVTLHPLSNLPESSKSKSETDISHKDPEVEVEVKGNWWGKLDHFFPFQRNRVGPIIKPEVSLPRNVSELTSSPEVQKLEVPVEVSKDGEKITMYKRDVPELLRHINTASPRNESEPMLEIKPIPMRDSHGLGNELRIPKKLRKIHSSVDLPKSSVSSINPGFSSNTAPSRPSSSLAVSIPRPTSSSSTVRPGPATTFSANPPNRDTWYSYDAPATTPQPFFGSPYSSNTEVYAYYGNNHVPQPNPYNSLVPANTSYAVLPMPYQTLAPTWHQPTPPPPMHPTYIPPRYPPASSLSHLLLQGAALVANASLNYYEARKHCVCGNRHSGRVHLNHVWCVHCAGMGCFS